MMKQLQFYKYATFGLLALNLAIVGFFFFTRPKPPHMMQGDNLFMRASEMLRLDPQQNEHFEESANAHKQKMKSINDRQRELLRPYFQRLIDPSITVDEAGVLAEVQKLEAEKVESTYQHFTEVKSILKPEQQQYFEEFMHQALRMILLEPQNAPPSKEEGRIPPRK